MRKSEEPLVVHRSLTWWLIDVCGSSAISLTVHLARTTIEPLQATTRDEWRHIVDTAMLQRTMLWKKRRRTLILTLILTQN